MKKLTATFLIFCVVAGGLRWILYEPYDAPRLFKPIPAYASFVSLHEDFAGRWKEWTRNPVAQSLLNSTGLRSQDLASAQKSPELQAMLSTLAGKRTLLAYIPSLGQSGRPGWAFTSHLGGRGVWLRWLLKLYPRESLLHLGHARGVDIWMVDDGSSDPERLYFSITRGMMVGCYAGDPTAQRRLLDLLDYGNPHWEELANKMDPEQVCSSGTAPDRGWLEVPFQEQTEGLRFSLERVDARTLKGQICGSVRIPLQATVDRAAVEEAIEQFSFPDSLIWGVTTPDSIPLLLRQFASLQKETVDLPNSVPVFLGLQGGAFSGRFLGMKVPSLLAAIPLISQAEGDRLVNGVLDEINRERKAGLVPRVSVQNGYALTLIDASVRSPYSLLSDKDKVACLYRNGWLMVATHAGALSQIAAWMDSGSTRNGPTFQTADLPALAHLWMDMESLRTTVPPILQMYKFKLLLDRGAESRLMRERLAEVEAWLESFEPFDQGRISLYSSPAETIMGLHLEGLSP
jgi:hypothetical protein